MFKDKTVLITGGTGSFGNVVIKRFLDTGVKEICIFSRDEKKQDDMRNAYRNDKLKFYIGDVRDCDSVYSAIHEVDYVFHAAALKQVPSCEFFPLSRSQPVWNTACGEFPLFCCIDFAARSCNVRRAYPKGLGEGEAFLMGEVR